MPIARYIPIYISINIIFSLTEYLSFKTSSERKLKLSIPMLIPVIIKNNNVTVKEKVKALIKTPEKIADKKNKSKLGALRFSFI